MKIITISGKAGAGKDTVGNMIKETLELYKHRVLIIHYADLLKYICSTYFGWDGEKDEAGRSMLQHIGTDIVRKKAPDFWVDFIADTLYLFPDAWDFVIIPDARFPNEIERLKEVGHVVTSINVIRDRYQSSLTSKQLNHASESSLDGYPFDYVIDNNGSIDDLRDSVIVACGVNPKSTRYGI